MSKDRVMDALAVYYSFDLDRETNPLMYAGAVRNLLRHAEADGLKVMSILALFLEPNEDPVELVVSAMKALKRKTRRTQGGKEDAEKSSMAVLAL